MDTSTCDCCSKVIKFPFGNEIAENSLMRLFDNKLSNEKASFHNSKHYKENGAVVDLAKAKESIISKKNGDRQVNNLEEDVKKLVLNEAVRKKKKALSGKRWKLPIPNPEKVTESRQKTAREKVTDLRGGYVEQDVKFNFEVDNDSNYYILGYLPESVNVERRSRWYNIMKDIHSCLPLSYHLLPPSEEATTEKVTLHALALPDGKVVYNSKLEYKLRESDFGTYLGLLHESGQIVVVREFNPSTSRAESTKALSNKRQLKHKNIVKFFGSVQVDLKVRCVSELCEFNLYQFVKEVKRSNGHIPVSFVLKQIIMDLSEGVKYLHKMQVAHGFLKPSNVMVTMDCKLKLADCFLLDLVPLIWGIQHHETKMKPIGSSVSSSSWRPAELISAENEVEARENISLASDIQMAGMLMYFILSGGKHRFGRTDAECQENIKQGFLPPRLEPMDYEAKDLINGMMKKNKSDRPNINTVAKHPYFWNNELKFQFIIRVGKKLICENKESKDIEDFRKHCSDIKHWTSFVYPWLITYLCKQTSKFYTNDPYDLLHFAVALQNNYETIPLIYKQLILKPSRFILQVFPAFFTSVYNLVRQNSTLQRQSNLQNLF